MRTHKHLPPPPPFDEPLGPDALFDGRFRIMDLVGRGQTGDVYLVDCPPQAASFVLKVMRSSLAPPRALRSRFVREAKSTAQIPSPYLLHTLDAGMERASGRLWFTTPLLRGHSLAERVAREGAQPPSDVHELLAALAGVLGMAHARGIVHYDLTPENVHLGTRHPFALALRELTVSRFVAEACAARGELIGGVAWMAPEQLDVGRRLTPGANVWSLGLLIFYAAVGRPYWLHASSRGEVSRELLREVLHTPIVAASRRARDLGHSMPLPPWFDEWFSRCVTRDPRNRFANAAAAWDFVADMSDNRLLGLAEDIDDEERTNVPLRRSARKTQNSRSVPPGLVAEIKAEAARGDVRGRHFGLALAAVVVAVAGFAISRPRVRHDERPPLSVVPAPGHPASPASVPTQVPTSVLPEPSTTSAPSGGTGALDPAPQAPSLPARPAAATFAEPAAANDDVTLAGAFNLNGALDALRGVHYGVCAVRIPGKIAVSFAPSGRVEKVRVLRGRYDDKTLACLFERFGTARTPPFHGNPQAVTAEIEATR